MPASPSQQDVIPAPPEYHPVKTATINKPKRNSTNNLSIVLKMEDVVTPKEKPIIDEITSSEIWQHLNQREKVVTLLKALPGGLRREIIQAAIWSDKVPKRIHSRIYTLIDAERENLENSGESFNAFCRKGVYYLVPNPNNSQTPQSESNQFNKNLHPIDNPDESKIVQANSVSPVRAFLEKTDNNHSNGTSTNSVGQALYLAPRRTTTLVALDGQNPSLLNPDNKFQNPALRREMATQHFIKVAIENFDKKFHIFKVSPDPLKLVRPFLNGSNTDLEVIFGTTDLQEIRKIFVDALKDFITTYWDTMPPLDSSRDNSLLRRTVSSLHSKKINNLSLTILMSYIENYFIVLEEQIPSSVNLR